MSSPVKLHSSQNILNWSFDETFKTLMIQLLGSDGQNTQRLNANNLAYRIVASGTVTYIARSAPGTSVNSPYWQAFKVDETSGTIITWADGDANFNNVASDIGSLTYS